MLMPMQHGSRIRRLQGSLEDAELQQRTDQAMIFNVQPTMNARDAVGIHSKRHDSSYCVTVADWNAPDVF